MNFGCRQFASVFVGVMPLLKLARNTQFSTLFSYMLMPLLELRILEIYSFSHFSPTCFDVLSWNIVYDFHNALQIKFKCRQFLFCPFLNQEYWKYTVIRTFVPYALTYWAEIMYMTFFLWTSDQVIVITWGKVWRSYAPIGCTVLHTLLVHALKLSWSF